MYRKFWLKNKSNQTWEFTDKSIKSFLQNPQGLGYQSTLDVTQYGEALTVNVESFAFPKVSGDLQFYDSANGSRYDMYNRYVKFCMDSPLVLCYQIDLNGTQKTFNLPCYCTTVTKTESNTHKTLSCPVSFYGLGFWQDATIYQTAGTSLVTVLNDSDFPVGFYIKIDGTNMENPYFTLKQSNELYGEGKFIGTYSSVSVNSQDGKQELILKRGNAIVANPLSYQDLSISNGSIYVTFAKLARGLSAIDIGCDSGTITSTTVTFVPLYRSV